MKKIPAILLTLFMLILGVGTNPTKVKALAKPEVIIEKKDEWAYYNEGPDQFPGEDWYSPEFDDRGWNKGNGIFGYKSGGTFDTPLSYGNDKNNKYPTYFFRKQITLSQTNLNQYDLVDLNINIDDGAIFFINGVEVLRYNYGPGPIDYTKGVSALGGNGNVYLSNQFPLKDFPLKEGVNTVAVVLFQQKPTSSDVAFDLEMVLDNKVYNYDPVRVNQSFYGDVLTKKGFTWHTADEARSDIRFTVNEPVSNNLINPTYQEGVSYLKPGLKGFTHKVEIDELTPNTRYYYQVGDKSKDVWSDVFNFKTGSENSGVNVGFITDSQGWQDNHYEYSGKTMDKTLEVLPNLDFFLQGGDLVDTSSSEQQWHSLFEKARLQWANNTVMSVSGNHDVFNNTFNDHFNFSYPDQNVSNGTYYSFDYDNTHFTMLNTNDASSQGLGEDQFNWIEQDLKQARANGTKWIVVTMHKGTQTVAGHIDDSDVVAMRAQLQSLFSKYNVDLVLQGHDHVYSRTVPLDGLNPQLNVESFTSKGVKNLSNPSGTTYLNGNTSGVKFYNPWSDEDIAKYGVYPDIKLQDNKQTFVTLEITDEQLSLNSYSFSVEKNEEPQLIDSLVIIQNDQSALENKIASMPSNINDDYSLFLDIEKQMNLVAYEERIMMEVYPKYLEMLAQDSKTVNLLFDDQHIIHEKGYPILKTMIPTKEGFEFKYWQNAVTGLTLDDSKIDEDTSFISIWKEKEDNLEYDNGKDKEIEPELPSGDDVSSLPQTGVETKFGLLSIVLLSLGSGLFLISSKKSKE